MSPHAVPHVELSGSPYEIGLQHGRLLSAQIISQLAIYRALFQDRCKLDWPQVLDLAVEFRSTVQILAPDLLEEMLGIADGVAREDVSVLDIIALNARSELALGKWDDGCTSIAWQLGPLSTGRQILAQNWDWRTAVGANLAMVSIAQKAKPKIWMVTEPGIIGKIGFNEDSVGVCLNAIRARPISTALLPIHLLLRIALECSSAAEAIAELERLGGPASSQHILIADTTSATALELSPRGSMYIAPDAHGVLIHTNHFLQNRFIDEIPWLTGSPIRLERAENLCTKIRREGNVENTVTPELLRTRIFSDTYNSPQAICCSGGLDSKEDSGTLFNIVMEFQQGNEPKAEVLFGKPGPSNRGPVLLMPW